MIRSANYLLIIALILAFSIRGLESDKKSEASRVLRSSDVLVVAKIISIESVPTSSRIIVDEEFHLRFYLTKLAVSKVLLVSPRVPTERSLGLTEADDVVISVLWKERLRGPDLSLQIFSPQVPESRDVSYIFGVSKIGQMHPERFFVESVEEYSAVSWARFVEEAQESCDRLPKEYEP